MTKIHDDKAEQTTSSLNPTPPSSSSMKMNNLLFSLFLLASTLSPSLVRVSLRTSVPSEDLNNLCYATRTRHLFEDNESQDQKSVDLAQGYMTNVDLERAIKEFGQRCSNISRIYRKAVLLAIAKLTCNLLNIEIFGDHIIDRIGVENIKEIVNRECLGASVMTVYIRYLYEEFLLPNERTRRFPFLFPHRTDTYSFFGQKSQTHYIADRFAITEREYQPLFLVPCNVGDHWVLLAINHVEEIVYYLDSLHSNPRNHPELKNLFNR